jgi:hypothetical protein
VVTNFEGKQISRGEALRVLFGKPEIRAAMSRFNLELNPSVPETGETRNIDSIDGSGLTVRQILHQIAKKGGSRFWVFRRTGPANKQFTIEMPSG